MGTALWGWGVERAQAFALMDRFASLGGRIVDTASNYPINKCPQDYGRALAWIAEWQAANADAGLSVLVKVGGVRNDGSPETDLSPGTIQRLADQLQGQLNGALGALSIHWDNRGDTAADHEGIAQTVEVMSRLHAQGLSIGLSGIRHPHLYRQAAPALADQWWIQVKENMRTRQARLAYETHFPHARYLAYGINMGGFKLERASGQSSLALRGIHIEETLGDWLAQVIHQEGALRPAPETINDLALLTACLNPRLYGVIVGPRNVEQLVDSMAFCRRVQAESDAQTVAELVRLGLLRDDAAL
ncbi:aldo/keto reductase [Castellaniella caeni]|uniref:aldo/keto reductase n=1 Tax=Castellaniella caeni TaxID=266123 RepID=UPI0015E088E7|nr:aldo/keto reductase [Castellaniella caeni]